MVANFLVLVPGARLNLVHDQNRGMTHHFFITRVCQIPGLQFYGMNRSVVDYQYLFELKSDLISIFSEK